MRLWSKGTNKGHYQLPLLTSHGNSLQKVDMQINPVRLHLPGELAVKALLKGLRR